jgi:hypothetical protein
LEIEGAGMAMSKEEIEGLVVQLQQAHRISAAFYRRILPLFDSIAERLDCTFYSWGPAHTNRPSRGSSRPSQSWAWDYLPLYSSMHTYKRVADESRVGLNDFGVEFYLDIEDSFRKSINGEPKRQPDAIELPPGKSMLEIHLYRLKKAENASFAELWEEQAAVSLNVGELWTSVSGHWEGKAFAWSLASVICDSEPIIADVRKHMAVRRI